MVKCNKCGDMFEKYSTRYMCKPCNKEYNTSKKDHIKKYNQNRYENNKTDILRKIKEYHQKNRENIKAYSKQWFQDNKEKVNEYNRQKYQNDIIFKLKLNLRNTLKGKLNAQGVRKNKSSLKLTGCTIEYLKTHIETQFHPEMSWDNYGNVWEIDHIRPCASFDLTDIVQQKECFYYTNLQPLFKTTEIAKSFGYIDQIGNRNKSKKYDPNKS